MESDYGRVRSLLLRCGAIHEAVRLSSPASLALWRCVRSMSNWAARPAFLSDARTSDPIDATVVLVAADGDRILTSDTRDLKRLAAAARKRVAIIEC